MCTTCDEHRGQVVRFRRLTGLVADDRARSALFTLIAEHEAAILQLHLPASEAIPGR